MFKILRYFLPGGGLFDGVIGVVAEDGLTGADAFERKTGSIGAGTISLGLAKFSGASRVLLELELLQELSDDLRAELLKGVGTATELLTST